MPTSSFYAFSTPTVAEVNTVQDQLDEAAATVAQAAATATQVEGYLTETTNTQTVNYTLVLGDRGKLVAMNLSGANTLTVPPNSSVAFPTGTWINIAQLGAGKTTVVAGSGVTINTSLGLSLRARYSGGSLIKTGADTWLAVGDLDT